LTEDGQAPLSASDRRYAIQLLLLEQQEVAVQELVDRFAVSVMTIHRDLDALEGRGVLRKVRGGATAQPSSLYESSLAFRVGENMDAKSAIARTAAQHVAPGSSLVLDDSTTALAMLPHLAATPQLTIVTNFVSVIDGLRDIAEESMEVIFVGGTYSSKYHSFGGVLTENWLRDFRVDQCFLSVSAIDLERGAFHREADHAALKRAMIGIAAESILLVDVSKFHKRAMHQIVGLEAFDLVIVDEETPDELLVGLRARGVEVEVAPMTASASDADAAPATGPAS
jgi:DeoR/GlpR family transcriptional regulator of sugar metabolism